MRTQIDKFYADESRIRTMLSRINIVEFLVAALTVSGEIAKALFPALEATDERLFWAYRSIEAIILICFTARVVVTWRGRQESSFRALSAATVIFVLGLAFLNMRLASFLALIHDGFLGLRQSELKTQDLRFYQRLSRKPAATLVVTFLLVSGIGGVLLALPSSQVNPSEVTFIDALFTAISATCVTGLATVDTSSAWTPFGQTVLLLLIQLGGLGIMVFGSALSLSLGQKLKIFERDLVEDVFDDTDTFELRSLLKGVLGFTIAIELFGALLLYPIFRETMVWNQALGFAVFHSVSAFCNAGFSLFPDSLVGFQSNLWVNVIIGSLFTLGGFGFGILLGLFKLLRRRKNTRLSLQARGVLTMSLILLVAGALLWFLFEYDGLLKDKPFGTSILISVFQSATTRTAGFNTIALDEMQSTTIVLMSVLMLIGASPGSTGGGIKTTTLLVVALAIRAFIRGRKEVTYHFRTIELTVVLKALAILGAVLSAFLIGTLCLLWLEPTLSPMHVVFESASALGTTGLSMGITGELSTPGKLIVCILMFFGRLGPLTIATAALIGGDRGSRIKYPSGRINVG